MNVSIPDFSGSLITPESSAYEEARRVWNGMIDRRPAVIAQCASEQDVVKAVDHARTHQLPIAVRCGGHSVAGHSTCEGGMMIDLGLMDQVAVDPDARRARVQGGTLLARLDEATQEHGLAMPSGAISHTGVGGLVLGGGQGWLMRKFGLSIDNLTSVRVVTADGDVLRASADEHPDLFWAVRGGGGNFGVVTEFEFGLHEVGPHFLGVAIHRLERAHPALETWRNAVDELPDDVQWNSFLRMLPPFPWVPEGLSGQRVLLSALLYIGDATAGERTILPILDSLEPDGQFATALPHCELQRGWDDVFAPGKFNYHKAGFIDDLSNDLFDVLLEAAAAMPSPSSHIEVIPQGGAIRRVPTDATAYPHRQAGFIFNVIGMWEPDADAQANIGWVRETYDALWPHSNGGLYVNYMGGEESGGIEAVYGHAHARLQVVKAIYDPDNVFSLNRNIAPAH
jgi:hypothetical protein